MFVEKDSHGWTDVVHHHVTVTDEEFDDTQHYVSVVDGQWFLPSRFGCSTTVEKEMGTDDVTSPISFSRWEPRVEARDNHQLHLHVMGWCDDHDVSVLMMMMC